MLGRPLVVVLSVLLGFEAQGVLGAGSLPIAEGDVFSGQFETGALESRSLFELRLHSPVHGQTQWSMALGPQPGWMTHCSPASSCAGGELNRPVSGTMNVTGVGSCTEQNTCSAPPEVQPSTGCIEYGCQVASCGCDPGTGNGCWGKDMRGQIALIQRGEGVGESFPDGACTFSLKIHNAQEAGAVAAVVMNNNPYGAVFMASDDVYDDIIIPAVFVTRDAGLKMFRMINEAAPWGLEASLTNLTESSLRLTIDTIKPINVQTGVSTVEGTVEFRLEGGGPDEGFSHEAFPYGSFRVVGVLGDEQLNMSPVCSGDRQYCEPSELEWIRRPVLHPEMQIDPHDLGFGFRVTLKSPGTDGADFEHMIGAITHHRRSVRGGAIKLRRVVECTPTVHYMVDCEEIEGLESTQCLTALDEMGYRVFNDVSEGGAPLFWYCRNGMYCEGEYLSRSSLQQLLHTFPTPCSAGAKNKYLFLGPDDWRSDMSLHMCGFGSRANQEGICSKLPSVPLSHNPSGWYFNTTCLVQGADRDCGHNGWWMQDGFVSSCRSEEECSVDNSVSTLDLHVKLNTAGSVSFTYTANGEQFYDFMRFTVNDETVHHTRSFFGTGRYVRMVALALPAGEHKLSWAWVKDFSLSFADDRATLHQILITGTGNDDQCEPCPAGFCGNGGLEGCHVCPKSEKSSTTGAKFCEACGDLPGGATFTGPEHWPQVGNTGTCAWECSQGYCSSDHSPRCSSTTQCPAGMCCPHHGQCYLAAHSAVLNGEPGPSLQMLKSCLALTPVDQNLGTQTLSAISSMLGPDGLYAFSEEKVPGGQWPNKAALISNMIGTVSSNILDTSMQPSTRLPTQTDWHSLHQPILDGMRSSRDGVLAYVPPTFYQDVAFFLPWSMRFAYEDMAVAGCVGVQCEKIHISGFTPAFANVKDVEHYQELPCSCQTCRCSMTQTIEGYIGWEVESIDWSGDGTVAALEAIQKWADENALGSDAGARLVYALNSGDNWSSDKTGKFMVDNEGGHAASSAGQFGCSFAHRTMGNCGLPTCTDDFCHVTLVLKNPKTQQRNTLHVPWIVSYNPAAGRGNRVDCTQALRPPFDANVQCMKEVVVYGKKGANAATSVNLIRNPTCTGQSYSKGWEVVFNPAAISGLDKVDPACYNDDVPIPIPSDRGTKEKVWNLDNELRSASGYAFHDPYTGMKTGVLALKSFASEQLALHTVIGELSASRPDSLILDLRGNNGGDFCHIFDLAYLVSNAFSTPTQAQEKMAMHLRTSKMMEAMVTSESIAGYAPFFSAEAGYASDQFADLCSVVEERADGKTVWACRYDGPDWEYYTCGDYQECYPNCRSCVKEVNGVASEWSHPFRPRCSGEAKGLLEFDKSIFDTCSASGPSETIRTTKAWDGCGREGSYCGFDRGSLTILTDGRCVGVCAIFVKIMQIGDLAQIISPAMPSNPVGYFSPAGMVASAWDIYCQMQSSQNGNISLDPTVGQTQHLPSRGQDLLLPIAAATFLDEKKNATKTRDRVWYFPFSEKAHKCTSALYLEAAAAASVCAISIPDELQEAMRGEVDEGCNTPFARKAQRHCNSSCPHKDIICTQFSANMVDKSMCAPTCWSPCSVIECREGYEKIWIGNRHICWDPNANSLRGSSDFELGRTLGYQEAMDWAEHRWAWRANLSGWGATFLILFLMAFAGILGRWSAGTGGVGGGGITMPAAPSLPSMGDSDMKGKAAAAAAGVGVVLAGAGAFMVTQWRNFKDSLPPARNVFGGSIYSGGGGDSVNLTGAGATTTTTEPSSDYNAL